MVARIIVAVLGQLFLLFVLLMYGHTAGANNCVPNRACIATPISTVGRDSTEASPPPPLPFVEPPPAPPPPTAPNGCTVYATLVDGSPSSGEAWRYHYDGARPGGSITQPPLASYQTGLALDIRTDPSIYSGSHLYASADSHQWRIALSIPHGEMVYVNNYQRGQHSDYDGDGESGNLNRYVYLQHEVHCRNGAISIAPHDAVISDKFGRCTDASQNRSADYFAALTGLGCDDDDDINNKVNLAQPYKVWQGGGRNRDIVFQRIGVRTAASTCPAMTMTGKYPGSNRDCFGSIPAQVPGISAQLRCTMNGATNTYSQTCQSGGVYGEQALHRDY
ncbi:hypothetical protein [Hydrocarboniphaga effusa]|uniref:hypothetical protein n=1 Tax=Hydrocarboniphaga effusa TaxID=243629 RepID=UPI00313799D4